MYKLGTSEDLWACREAHPEVFLDQFIMHSLKPLGHAMVVQQTKTLLRQKDKIRVLEIGHGANSLFFNLFHNRDNIELHGLDDHDKEGTVNTEDLARLRQRYPGISFHSGYIGQNNLPADYFDLVFSVSVIEHVAEEALDSVQADMFRILCRGGLQFHSYDRPYGADVDVVKRAIERAGFAWIEDGQRTNFWSLTPSQIGRVVFEHPFNVMEKFMFAMPREGRALYNWVTVFVGALEPLI